MIVDVSEVIHGLLVAETETEPGKKTVLEFGFVVNQGGTLIQKLRKVLTI